jgi:hypothetical protein
MKALLILIFAGALIWLAKQAHDTQATVEDQDFSINQIYERFDRDEARLRELEQQKP